ncbi:MULTISPECIES: c-type cytochrome [Idiomarina]|jgi:cytochrome c553|uniref:Cytochrome c4 n=2 Tax=Idiomarina baltica TaxID=190892 RepID=A0A348WP91_9GAMM|nr:MULTISPECIES: c-type cytochrome [Idiomarina]MAF75269.1 cytochrome c4 [Idiomarinaceae bacterium]MEC8924967.1 c-type cytochrome [Pseudomonadota bacterium]EAQ33335.1 Cytochrome c4 [Idiomarina baltica OS145]KXS34635.1 MAG: cytochrome c4 [Idiomarina sp. T82-3]MBR37720.1 cytochrome c4 [Idiomarina sp.]|tara:strand:- start:4647 stop:5273 length:627 start_codon:yes stop_codon:yes gene_type:complete
MKKFAIILGLFISSTSVAMAQQGDVEAGKQKSQVCAACHGPNGVSPSDMYPNLAGQHPKYIYKQLMDFKTASETGGEQGRNNAIMMGQVANLSEQDMKDLAAYFAAQDPAKGDTPEDLIAKGSDLFRRGNPETNIPSCAGCHGPRGNGMGLAAFPDISGQHPAYVISQLENFRSGKRANDPNGMMRGVAAKMTDEEMKLLAEYLHGLY